MDPNANLSEQATLLQATALDDKRRRAELRRALQAWLAAGGFEPRWDDQPDATRAYGRWVRANAMFADLAR